ncbi:MAG: hypothetical protein BroJett021_01240 [Chloroflexota bacterium]|jgi:hypothetical protein|nr:BrnA antitoxin family protein [Caldilinea sp.]GIK71136.1 MAG: hypothetical protein BroJett021_01240 [Chloroflexota bacterium]
MSEDIETRLSSISKADSCEAIGEFWDTHSLADYWNQTYEVEFEVRIPRCVRIEANLFARIADEARRRGVSAETLVNLWIAERLLEKAASSPAPVEDKGISTAQRELQLAEVATKG